MRALLFLASFLGAVPAVACTCVVPEGEVGLSQEFDGAAAVFLARVERVERVEDSSGSFKRVHMKPQKIWKTDGKEISVVETASSTSSCGALFSAGKTHIVFAYRERSFWSFLPFVKEPLYVGYCGIWMETTVPAWWVFHQDDYQDRLHPLLRFLERKKVQK